MRSPVVEQLEELHVDLTDPFFFDHSLDHLPGMLLVSGLLDLARKADDARFGWQASDRVRSRLAFTKICEIGQPATLVCVPEPLAKNRCWNVAVIQGEDRVCGGVIEFIKGDPAERRAAVAVPHSRVHAAAPAQLVHRRRPENVLVGALSRNTDEVCEASVLSPPKEHSLIRFEPEFRSPLELIEAGRQFLTMLEHSERGRPAEIQLLWLSLTTDIPRRIPRTVPLTLRWPVTENQGHRSHYAMSLVDADTSDEHGTLEYGVTAMDPERYANLRAV